ncbi:capsule assembly Wzi family protein [Salinimicrobium catena]|uniref:capsule assembly Wzi family protein n=1 Tax=Salinimicrobium catena TaxID=390640 RepID=UPI002FE4D800
MVKRLPLLFLIFYTSLQAQYFDYSASAVLQGIYSSKEESPFWMHSNTRGRIDEATTLAGWSNVSARYFITPDSYLDAGIGGAYQNGYNNEFWLDEYYVSFENDRYHAFIGRKQKKEIYNGLSATNSNILWSLHARPVPGVGFEIKKPITFWKEGGLGFKASWEEYITDDERYVDNLKIHHKSFHFVFTKIRNIELVFGLQHFAQWGGISPDYGRLPQTFHDYLNVWVGKEGKDDVQGEEANALGNHLGSYEIYLNTSFSHYDVQLIYNTIFEDNSGRVLGNTPDGRFGIYIEDRDDEIKWITALMYEFYYTRDQSKNTPTGDGKDNYFNNNLYRSGWTYENRILGAPFFLLDDERFRIDNNTFYVHHVGLAGTAFFNYPYRFLGSFRMNYGVKGGQENPISKILSTYLDIRLWERFFTINLQAGVDVDLLDQTTLGAGIKLSKKFF